MRDLRNRTPNAEMYPPAAFATFQHVDSGIYRYTGNGNYYERFSVNGKRTWRSLKTSNLKFARERLHQRRAETACLLRRLRVPGGGDEGLGGF